MIDVSQAQNIIFNCIETVTESELVDIKDSFGRILAEDVISKAPLPPFRASMKDGYAILQENMSMEYFVVDRSNAGDIVCKLID